MTPRAKRETVPQPEAVPSNGNYSAANFPGEVRRERSVPDGGYGMAAAELLWNRRRTLVRFAMWGVIVSVAIALLIPNYYRSTSRLMPPAPDSGMSMLAMSALSRASGGMGMGLAGNLLGFRTTGSLFIGILRSRSVEDRIIERFDLRRVYGKKEMDPTRKLLELNTDLAEDKLSGIITVTVTDHDPNRAAEMAKAFVDELNARLSEVDASSAHKERVFIEGQLKDTKQELDKAAQTFSQFASKNTAIDIQEQGKAMVESAARLQGELIASESELKGLEQIYTSTNVHVRSLKARIGELQSQLAKIGGTQADAKSDTEEPGAYPSIRKLPLLGVTYFDLYRQTKIQEAIYEFLSQQYEMAKVQEAKELPSARVLDAPVVPEKKSGPVRTLMVMLGLMLALAGGAVWIIVEDRWNDVDEGDPRKRLAREIYFVSRARVERVVQSRPFQPVRALVRRFRPEPHADRAA